MIIKVQHAIGFVLNGEVLAILILGIDKSDITLTHMLDACSYYIAYKYPIVNRQPLSVEW